MILIDLYNPHFNITLYENEWASMQRWVFFPNYYYYGPSSRQWMDEWNIYL